MTKHYSSSKTAWPTKNLFVGGGPSRPFHQIVIKPQSPLKNRAVRLFGPTRTAARQMLKKQMGGQGYEEYMADVKEGRQR